jgi:hypothetical protein
MAAGCNTGEEKVHGAAYAIAVPENLIQVCVLESEGRRGEEDILCDDTPARRGPVGEKRSAQQRRVVDTTMIVEGLNGADIDVRVCVRREEALTSQCLRHLCPNQLDVTHAATVDDEVRDGGVAACVAFRVELGCAAQDHNPRKPRVPVSPWLHRMASRGQGPPGRRRGVLG